MFKKGRKIAVSLLGILSTLCIAGGVSACKNKSNPMMAPENATTVRMVTPNDGSLPTAHEALENIGYMAYTLDNQDFYHAYANNSSKAMGYEQVTQTWKDYKSAALTGIGESVMICSDLSYSTLVKSSIQICSVGGREAYTRGGAKPGKNTTSTTVGWSTDAPAYFDKDAYYNKYGEFSTELSVYVINEYTLADASEVTVKEDGTYEQTYYLNEQAGCWYQYKMKTNGSLKKYPKFEHVQITFNFDSSWRVLSSYCEEKIEITPGALGGIPATSNSKTSTTFYYGESDFDNAHYAYFDDYFKQYLGTRPGTSGGEEGEDDVLTIISSGFNKVVDPNGNGQQFDLALTLGDTEYVGKAYAKLSDMENILGSLDVRFALEKKGSGRQDLFIQFKGGAVDVYYSDDFALTVNIGSVGTVVNQFKDWIKIFAAPESTVSAAGYSLADGEAGSDSALAELLSQLKHDLTDDAAYVTMTTDNLMGTGIGVNLNIDFNRTRGGDGSSTYSFKGAGINSITYDSTSIKLSASLSPDESGLEPITREENNTAADLCDYMNSVYNMLNSDSLKVQLKLDGSGNKVISALDGADVELTAYLKLGNELSLKTDLSASYGGVSAKLSAYYGVNLSNGGYGVVYLNLTELNGKPMDGKIRCNINETVDAVKQLISSISGAQAQASAAAYSESDANGLAQIINKALCLDFEKIFGDVYASNSQIRLSLDIDEVIGGIGIDVKGLKFGTAALALNNGEKASFALSLPALGFTASVSGSTQTVIQPDAKDYLNVTEIINLVKAAADEANKIIDAKDIAFDIDLTVIIDDVPLSVKGKGEVVWVDGSIKVALDVYLSVADGTASSNRDGVALKLTFDPSAQDGAPVARFAVNSLGIEIYQSDLDNTKADFENIINSVKSLLGGNKTGNATPEEAVALLNSAYGAERSSASDDILNILNSGNVQSILKAVLGFVSDITSVELDYNADEEVSGLVIRHAVNGSLSLGVNGNLSIALEVNDNNGTRIVEGSAAVAVGNGSAFAALGEEFANGGYSFYTTAEAEKAFVKVVYDYLFAVIEDVSIAEVLGGKTYTVQLTLDGAKSAIPALQNISVDASIYYTEGLDGDKIVTSKLAEIDLVLNIGEVPVSLNARYNAGYIFIDLRTIDNLSLTDIMVKADVKDIYSVCEQVIDLITSKAVADLIGGNAGADGEEVVAMLSLAGEGETKASLTSVLAKLFTLNFNEAFSYKKVDGVNTAVIQPDYVLNHLGVSLGYDIGVITVGINPVTHKIAADIDLNGAKWLTASAEAAERRVYAEGWQNDYIDISFVSSLLSDITKTAISGDTFNTIYTLTGEIDIGIHAVSIINIDLTVSNVKLTAGLDENGKFYLTLTGHLPSKKYLGFDVTKEMDISITYSGGYITFGRNLDSTPIYKVMTLEFFLDNIFSKSNSPVRWLLGTSDTAWNLVCNAIKVNIDSGLTKPESLYLYNQTQKPKEDKFFALGDILSGLSVKVDGKEGSYNGGSSAVSKWGLTDNYYALDINGDKLTGGTVKNLYAAILRDGEKGVTGLRVFAAVAGALEVNVKLNNLTTDRAEAAPDYLKNVNVDFDKFAGSTENTSTHTTSIFGCYSSETDSYESSEVLSTVTLTVLGYEGIFEDQTIELRYGSTVYLTNSFAPVWANEEHTLKLIFTDAEGNELGSQIVLNDDILDENRNFTVKAVATEVVEVNFNINLAGINTVTAALAPDEALTPYDHEISGFKFIGWYNDEAMTHKVTAADEITNVINGVKTVYGKFIVETVTVNGVIYTFTADETEIGGSYAVTGYDAEKIAPFTAEGSWLILENELYSVPVTSIAEGAFAEGSLKNVVVPENIVTIGARAFLDNYNINSVVLLADSVHMQGTDKNTVFYGCSLSDGGKTTRLSVYYNAVTADAGNNWTYFRDGGKYIGRDGGGALYAGGNWSYTRFNLISGDGVDLTDSNFGFNTDGIKTSGMTAEQMKAEILKVLNNRTAADGVINEYLVTVDNGYANNGKMNTVNINVEVNEAPYYAVTVNSDIAGSIIDGTIEIINGAVFAQAGTTVSVLPPDGYEFDTIFADNVTLTEGDGGIYTYIMPDGKVTVNATCKKAAISTVTLNSAVAYSYNGLSYAANEQTVISGVEEGVTVLSAPEAEGYVFLGWAYNNGTSLEFTSSTVQYSTYYAIWGVARDEISGVTPVTSGTDVNADISNVQVNQSYAHEFYKWYLDAGFNNEASVITIGNTVLYSRVIYTATVQFSLKSNMYIVYGDNDTAYVEKNSKTHTEYVYVLEGAVLNIAVKEENVYRLEIDSEIKVADIRVKQRNFVGNASGTKQLSVSCSDIDGWNVNTAYAVTGNLTFTFTSTF